MYLSLSLYIHMAVSILLASITFIVSGAPRNHFNRFRNLSEVAGKGSGGGRVFPEHPSPIQGVCRLGF